MIDILYLLLFNSLLIWGLYLASDYDYNDNTGLFYSKGILWWIAFYTRNWVWWVRNPLIACTGCMASVHGSYVFITYLYLNDYPIEGLYLYPFYVLALSGMNHVVGKFINQ
jgi:hypothetical protein